MAVEHTEVFNKTVSRGRNIHASVAIAAKRVVSHATSATYEDAIDTTANVAALTRLAGVTAKAIDAGRVGDVHTEGVVPVESTGGEILVGHRVAVEQSTGRVYSAVTTAPGAGANVWLCGIAKTYVAAASAAGTVVMIDLHFAPFQG